MTLVDDTAAWKRRDAALYGELPPRFADYVARVGAPIVDEIVRLARLAPGERVLDVGSGTGTATVALARAVAPNGRALGIDYSRARCEEASRNIPAGSPLSYALMDAEQLALARASFDCVVSFSALFHFPHPERALREMRRVLRASGRLVLTYHAAEPPPALDRRVARARETLTLRAPDELLSLADAHLPRLAVPAVAEWSLADAEGKLRGWLASAGFALEEETWAGDDVAWTDAEDFFDAQMMIHSDLRARASEAGESARHALRREFTRRAADVLRRGGGLVYPFGAVCLCAAAR